MASMNVAPRQSFYHLSRRKLLVFGVVLLVAAAVYGIDGLRRNAPDTACAGAVKAAQRLSPLAYGEVASFTVAEQALRVPDLAFRDADSGERHLSQWRGRTVLLNLWATWCVPCRREMRRWIAVEQRLGGPPSRLSP
jgi:thiol:disulfide interchange protein